MSEALDLRNLTAQVLDLVREAGAAILRVYASEFAVEAKDDASPLTEADMAAHRILVEGLSALEPRLPVLSEEGAGIAWSEREQWERHWLVDPLDGTREFVKRNGEFTVNVALIEGSEPVIGVVHAPALDLMYLAWRGGGAWRIEPDGEHLSICTLRPAPRPLRVAASRSHLDARTQALLERLGECERIGMGSSLKFCRIAEGRADVYPRFGPTSEWDTAAAQCVLEQAGGAVITTRGLPLRYRRGESVLNPDFLALGDPHLPWRDWLEPLA
jgi:3'(2'), 5'-bisphosphate nucleotidase